MQSSRVVSLISFWATLDAQCPDSRAALARASLYAARLCANDWCPGDPPPAGDDIGDDILARRIRTSTAIAALSLASCTDLGVCPPEDSLSASLARRTSASDAGDVKSDDASSKSPCRAPVSSPAPQAKCAR